MYELNNLADGDLLAGASNATNCTGYRFRQRFAATPFLIHSKQIVNSPLCTCHWSAMTHVCGISREHASLPITLLAGRLCTVQAPRR